MSIIRDEDEGGYRERRRPIRIGKAVDVKITFGSTTLRPKWGRRREEDQGWSIVVRYQHSRGVLWSSLCAVVLLTSQPWSLYVLRTYATCCSTRTCARLVPGG